MTHLPEEFKARIRVQRKDAEELFQALDTTPPVSVRLNPKKICAQFDAEATVPWCNKGKYLSQRPSFTKDPLFHAGCYYPQEAGSMFIDAVLKQLDLPDTCVALDLCAAPGGKTTILLDNLPENGLVIANEIIRNRAFVLRDNLTRWGALNCMVTNRNAADFARFEGLFDLVLVDAPCSGEGMFRKDMNARSEWSTYNTSTCALRQSEILDDIWPSIKQGGFLIYSTCTFNPAENDQQIVRLLENQSCALVALNFTDNLGLENQKDELGYACYPHRMQSEGFYFCVLKKLEETRAFKISASGRKNKQPQTTSKAVQHSELKIPNSVEITFLNDAFYAVPKIHTPLMRHIQQELGCLKFGIRLGEVISGKWIPHFEYALSHLDKTQFENYPLNLELALQYLKGNTIDAVGKDGWQLATYQGHALGWLKKIGPRINNYYPKELRIKMDL